MKGIIEMSKKEKKNILEVMIWINLLLGIYNLYGFVTISSYYNLIIGSLNIGVWVFYRHKLSRLQFFLNTKKVHHK